MSIKLNTNKAEDRDNQQGTYLLGEMLAVTEGQSAGTVYIHAGTSDGRVFVNLTTGNYRETLLDRHDVRSVRRLKTGETLTYTSRTS